MIKTALSIALLCATSVIAETPDEARQKLTNAYLEGEGHTLVYQLSKKGVPKGPKITMNIAKGRKYSAFFMQTPDGMPMAGIGYYSSGKGKKERVIISKAGLSLALTPFEEDLQEILNEFRDREGPAFSFSPQCGLDQNSINLTGRYRIAEEKPYPWKFLLEEDIEKVEREDDFLTLVCKNGMSMKFESATGILREQSYPGPKERQMRLISREKLTEFDPREHGLPAQPGINADLVQLAKTYFSECHKFMTLIAAGWLRQIPEEKQAEKLTAFQKRLNQHYREIFRTQPYLRDPMGWEISIKHILKAAMDKMLKKVEAEGKDPVEFLKAERDQFVQKTLDVVPEMASILPILKLYKIDPKSLNPKDRPYLEKILNAQKIAILRALTRRAINHEIDKRIGEN
jgi:hypothetical protein